MKLFLSSLIIGVFCPFCFIVLLQNDAKAQTKPAASSKQISIDPLTNRLVNSYTNINVDATDIMNKMLPDGSWDDIQYSDTIKALWGEHVKRLKTMAFAYRNSTNPLYNSTILLNKIILGFEYYNHRKYSSVNWWDSVIGVPDNYMVALILMKGKISEDLLIRFSSYLIDATDNPAHKGGNRTWVSAITIYKGCIENSFALVYKGFASMASTLTIEKVQGEEGIKIDNSFHQHRPQLYSGGYGMSMVSESSHYIALSANTLFAEAFAADKIRMLSELMLKGHQLFGYRGTVDFGTIGRNISRPNSTRNISPLSLDNMIQGDPTNATAYQEWKNHLSGGPFAKQYQGNKYFWKSDIMTHHGANYYLSAKVISTRTVGTEMLNQENLKGYNLPLGATNIMTTGNEYSNIFPVWDWTRIPGTTAVMNESATILPWYFFGSNSFAGGVSDSRNGIIAYEHAYNGVLAKKAYFLIGDAMLCMGSGINAFKTQAVRTSVNQCLLKDDIIFDNTGNAQTFTDISRVYTDLKWVYHDHVGYIFPEGGKITLQKAPQSGNWKSININGSEKTISQNVFSLWFNHGIAPRNESYCYIVVPDKSLNDFEKGVSSHGFVVIKNDANIQAIRNDNQHTYAAVFYNPGTVDMGDGLCITSDKKVLIMIEKNSTGYKIAVADPIYNQSSVTIKLNKNVKGPNATNAGGNSCIDFTFPTKDYIGKTVGYSYTIDRTK